MNNSYLQKKEIADDDDRIAAHICFRFLPPVCRSRETTPGYSAPGATLACRAGKLQKTGGEKNVKLCERSGSGRRIWRKWPFLPLFCAEKGQKANRPSAPEEKRRLKDRRRCSLCSTATNWWFPESVARSRRRLQPFPPADFAAVRLPYRSMRPARPYQDLRPGHLQS